MNHTTNKSPHIPALLMCLSALLAPIASLFLLVIPVFFGFWGGPVVKLLAIVHLVTIFISPIIGLLGIAIYLKALKQTQIKAHGVILLGFISLIYPIYYTLDHYAMVKKINEANSKRIAHEATLGKSTIVYGKITNIDFQSKTITISDKFNKNYQFTLNSSAFERIKNHAEPHFASLKVEGRLRIQVVQNQVYQEIEVSSFEFDKIN